MVLAIAHTKRQPSNSFKVLIPFLNNATTDADFHTEGKNPRDSRA